LNLFHRTHNSNRERQRATGTRGGQRAAGRPARYFPPAARYYKAGRTPLVMWDYQAVRTANSSLFCSQLKRLEISYIAVYTVLVISTGI
jgi:hypothetical protein